MKNLLFILLFIPFIGLGQNIIIPVFANGNFNIEYVVIYDKDGKVLCKVPDN